jgi:hypothetical protein
LNGAVIFSASTVARRIDGPEDLSVDVLVLLARVRVRRVHVLCDPVRNRTPVGAVLRPFGNRVAEILADDPLKRLHLPGLVELPEQIVERSVLEHDHDDMVERNSAVRRGHGALPAVEPKLRGPQRR